MTTTLITGANRGLGLEFARQSVAAGDTVYAGCRHPSDADDLNAIDSDRLHVLTLDVADDASIATAIDQVTGPIDRFINNAGIYGGDDQAVDKLDSQIAADVYRVNVIGPLMLLQAAASRLAADARVLTVSSGYGSIEQSGGGWPIMYCCSKAAVNMFSAIIGQAWPDRVVVAISPGWVRTDMGGDDADLAPEESVRGMLETLSKLTPADSGGFFDYRGERKPW